MQKMSTWKHKKRRRRRKVNKCLKFGVKMYSKRKIIGGREMRKRERKKKKKEKKERMLG